MEDVFKLIGRITVENAEANKSIDDTTKKAETAASKISKGFEKTGTFLSNVGQKITGAGKVVTATLTTGIAGLVVQGIKYNSEMENFQMNLTTLLGSADKASKLLSDLKEMAATTPFETTDLISATETMIGFGISADDAQKYLGVLGDISMGNSEKLSGLSLAFSQVQSTGKLMGQDLLQMINQGFNPLLYISKMTGESMAEVKERMSTTGISAEEVAKAFEYATQKGQPFYNAMENGAQTVSGRISTLKDNFNMLIGSLTESLLPTFEKVIDKAIELTEKFNGLSQEQKENILKWGGIAAAAGPVLIVFGKVTSGIGTLATAIGKLTSIEGVKTAISGFIKACGGASGALGAVAGIVALVASVFVFLKRNWDKVTQVFDNFVKKTKLAEKFEEIKSKLQPLWEKLKGLGDLFEVIGGIIVMFIQPAIAILAGLFDGVVSAISPLLDALGGIIDVLAGIGTFIKSVFTGDWQGAWDAIKQIVEGFKDFFVGIFDAIWSFIGGFFEGIISWFQGLFDALGITEFFNNMWTAISEWWNGVWTWLTGIWDTICNVVSVGFQLIASIIDAAWQLITLPFRFIWENCKEYVFAAWEWIKEKVSTAVNKVKEVITTVFNAVKGFVQTVWEGIKTYIITPITNAFNKVKEVVSNIKEAVVNRFNEVKSKVTEIWNNIKEKISTPINNAKTTVSNVVNGIKSTVSSVFDSVKSKVSSVWNGIKSAIETPINRAKDIVKSAIDKIKGFFNFKFEWPKLKMPHFGISPKGWSVGDLLKGSIPKLSIDWYAKAMNNPMILNEPTAFGMSPNGNLRVGGEAGQEVVAGADTLMNMISNAVAANNATMIERLQAIIEILVEFLPALANMQLVTDTGVLVGELAPAMDEELGRIEERKGRGR